MPASAIGDDTRRIHGGYSGRGNTEFNLGVRVFNGTKVLDVHAHVSPPMQGVGVVNMLLRSSNTVMPDPLAATRAGGFGLDEAAWAASVARPDRGAAPFALRAGRSWRHLRRWDGVTRWRSRL